MVINTREPGGKLLSITHFLLLNFIIRTGGKMYLLHFSAMLVTVSPFSVVVVTAVRFFYCTPDYLGSDMKLLIDTFNKLSVCFVSILHYTPAIETTADLLETIF